uniref:Thiamine-binding protein domain-containing protein n=1 Tax=Moniliophthora roreri TaxID=221103 RepID=A0A0W0FP96_MONRR
MPDLDLYAVADFCLIPMGTGEPSVAEYIAECQRVLEKSGVQFKKADGPKSPKPSTTATPLSMQEAPLESPPIFGLALA